MTTNATTRVRTVARTGTWEPDAESYVIAPQAYVTGRLRYAGLDHRLIAGAEYITSPTRNDVFTRALPVMRAPASGFGSPYCVSSTRWRSQPQYALPGVFRAGGE